MDLQNTVPEGQEEEEEEEEEEAEEVLLQHEGLILVLKNEEWTAESNGSNKSVLECPQYRPNNQKRILKLYS